MQLVSAETVAAAAPPRPSLSRLRVSPVDEMTLVAQARLPSRIGPDPGALPIFATIHTVVDAHKRKAPHDRPLLQQTGVGVLEKPHFWLQTPNEILAPLNQRVRFC